MTDGQLLLLIFALIYVSDAVAWFGERSYLLLNFYGKRLSIRRHRFFFPGFKSGAAFLNPLPWLGQGYVASLFPFSISEKGISPLGIENPNPGSAIFPPREAKAILWKDIERITCDQKKLYINRTLLKKFTSVQSARFWTDCLVDINEAKSAGERAAKIDTLVKKYLNENRVRRKLTIFRKAVRGLRFNANLLFVITFLILPFVYWRFRESRELLIACGMMWFAMINISIESFCLHRRFFPGSKGERVQHLFLSLFLPNHTIRSVDFLSKRFFCDTHPLALAKVAAREEDLAKFEQSLAHDIRHPVPWQSSGVEEAIAKEFRDKHYLPTMSELLSELNLNLILDLEAPAYCPRCLTPYESTGAVCDDCGGIPVVTLQEIS